MSLDPGEDALSSLLSILNDNDLKFEPSIAPVVNAKTTIDLLRTLLSRDDYINFAEKLRRDEDVMNVVELALHVLRHRDVSSSDATININRRTRRFMFKIISKTPVVPRSFIVTGVSMPEKPDYIGRGGYGNVFKGEFRGIVVALKVLYKNDANNLAFCREALMWGSLNHNFVLPFIGIHEEDDRTIFLVSPFMKNGTLAQWRKDTNPSIAQITERMLEVAQGMEYIHSEGVVHGDLRGENVLLDGHLHVQIADFGLTRLLDATNTQSGAKHINFAAPELFGCLEDADDPSAEDPPRTQMSDVYAFGCIYYEIHYDSIPFAGRRDMQIMSLVSRGKRPPRQDEPPLSDGAWELIQQCWVTEPPKRPRMKDVADQMMAMSTSSTMPPERDNKALLALEPRDTGLWPESVKKIFVEGLRNYWESPFATSSQFRGRSRWRNQFLVDYLKNAGVSRSKKQVASHIQVLRNTWKGEPEFHLVAGGDELYSESHTNIKLEVQGPLTSGGFQEYDDGDSSSNGTPPFSSPSEVKTEFLPSPGISLGGFPPDAHATPISSGLSLSSTFPSMMPPASSGMQRTYSTNMGTSESSSSVAHYDFSASPNFASHGQFSPDGVPSQAVSQWHAAKTTRVKALKLAASGIDPLWIRLDALTSHGQLAPNTPLTLNLQFGTNTSSTGYGFLPSLYFSSWTHSEKCITNLFINGLMRPSEDSPLTLTSSGDGCMTATLPASLLNHCRWLDASLAVEVTQEIVANNQTLLFVVYIMDRVTSGDLPFARLLNYRKYNHGDKVAAPQASLHTGQHPVTPSSYNNAYMSLSANDGEQASYM